MESFLGSSIKTEGDMADNDTENIKTTMSEVNSCVCEVCGFQSEVVDDMIWHKETVHGYVTFPCNLCNFVGKKQRLLKIHKLKTHGIGGVAKYPCHNCAYKARSEKQFDFQAASGSGNGYSKFQQTTSESKIKDTK